MLGKRIFFSLLNFLYGTDTTFIRGKRTFDLKTKLQLLRNYCV